MSAAHIIQRPASAGGCTLLGSQGMAWCVQAHGALVPRLSVTSFLRFCDRLRPPAARAAADRKNASRCNQ